MIATTRTITTGMIVNRNPTTPSGENILNTMRPSARPGAASRGHTGIGATNTPITTRSGDDSLWQRSFSVFQGGATPPLKAHTASLPSRNFIPCSVLELGNKKLSLLVKKRAVGSGIKSVREFSP